MPENLFEVREERDEADLFDSRPVLAHSPVQIRHLKAPCVEDVDHPRMGAMS